MNAIEIRCLQEEYAARIGERLRQMRKAAGYSQKGLGRYVAKDGSVISRYETGTLPLPAADIPILATRCNRSPAYLFQFWDTRIDEECRAVQEAIRASYEMMEHISVPDIDISRTEFTMPGSGVISLSSSAVRRMSDMGTAFYMNRMGYFTKEELLQTIVKIQTADYSIIDSFFGN